MSANRRKAAVIHAMLLCEGNQTSSLLDSVNKLIQLLVMNKLKIPTLLEVWRFNRVCCISFYRRGWCDAQRHDQRTSRSRRAVFWL